MNMYTRVSSRPVFVSVRLPVLLSLILLPLAASSASQKPPGSAQAASARAAHAAPQPLILAARSPGPAETSTAQASSRPTLPVSPEIEQRLPNIKQRILSALPPGAAIEKIVQPEGAESITAIPVGTPVKLTVAGTLGPGQNVIQAVATVTSRNADIGDAEVVATSRDPDNRTYFEFLLTISPKQ